MERKNIKYEIHMHNHWHCGSGLAAGADVDALAIKDKDGLPFIPGKTIKGLVREAVDEITTMLNDSENIAEEYLSTFGYFEDKAEEMKKSDVFFANAELRDTERQYIVSNGLSKYMYDSVAHTAIETNGIAKDHSLRKVEVVVPCVLEGEILNVPTKMVERLEQGMKFVKSLGLGRNRGLGRCSFIIK